MPDPITIRRITARLCRTPFSQGRGTYTDGSMDPEDLVWLFVTMSDGRHEGFGECVPTGIFYEPGHIGRSGIDEWAELLKLCTGLIGQDAVEIEVCAF